MPQALKELKGLTLWYPTEVFFITQPYGADFLDDNGAWYYKGMGLPEGHCGIDLRAPHGSKIFACTDGIATRVQTFDDNNAYGIHARITTKINNEEIVLIYGHFAKALISQGDEIKTGQVIGYADNTGWSMGSHLHLGLKLRGALERGLTTQPGDWIDPTPYLRMQYAPEPYTPADSGVTRRYDGSELREWPAEIAEGKLWRKA